MALNYYRFTEYWFYPLKYNLTALNTFSVLNLYPGADQNIITFIYTFVILSYITLYFFFFLLVNFCIFMEWERASLSFCNFFGGAQHNIFNLNFHVVILKTEIYSPYTCIVFPIKTKHHASNIFLKNVLYTSISIYLKMLFKYCLIKIWNTCTLFIFYMTS